MKRTLYFFVLLLLVTTCAPIYVNYDFEKNADFSKYKTYNYFGDIQTGLSDLDTKRLLDVLDLKMKEKGLTLSNNPDFYIDIKSSEFQAAQRNTVGVGVGGGGRNVGGGISIGLPIGQANVNRQIIFDFVDEDGIGLFWQAVSESSFNPNAIPEKREARLSAIVEKVLAKYPPK
ncbi:DUF4136 domain-containing protein [uncultured Algibacter sp.]|uniref:DUF4136 domain-containing protein n=1 Tax=uncultured Algibacter sp. TaxID=298659 RepID=UPI0026079BE1|nr:DUF4136 domain-containing protein [uncultured Algibacter sp.]